MPPPVPFLSARTLSAAETDGLLTIRPLRGHSFTSPPGTSTLYLPIATLVRVEHRGGELVFHGDFKRVNHPIEVHLAPVDPADAAALIDALAARHGLPRTPRLVEPHELGTLSTREYIEVTGTLVRAHFEAADFEGIKLDTPERHRLIAGQRYHAAGFFHPAPPPDEDRVGYSGAKLCALTVEPA